MAGKPKTVRFRREISLALVLKAIALGLIWLAWFSAPGDESIDASKAASHFFSQQSR
jgi:hypothetical protein